MKKLAWLLIGVCSLRAQEHVVTVGMGMMGICKKLIVNKGDMIHVKCAQFVHEPPELKGKLLLYPHRPELTQKSTVLVLQRKPQVTYEPVQPSCKEKEQTPECRYAETRWVTYTYSAKKSGDATLRLYARHSPSERIKRTGKREVLMECPPFTSGGPMIVLVHVAER